MEKQFVAVGSTRAPKLEAVNDALKLFADLLASDRPYDVLGFEVDSGVRHTPLTSAELMLGARQRAEALVCMAEDKRETYQYYVGLEGGLEVMHEDGQETSGRNASRRVFLESWAYVTNGSRGYFGRSGGIELPEALTQEVLNNGLELAVAIDEFAGMKGVRDSQGAWGILSGGLITRREAFRTASIAALAPFYNVNLFGPAVLPVDF